MRIARTLLLILLALWPASSPAAEPRADLRWFSWNQGIAEASASKRPILIDVYTDWCGWCKRMDRDVYSRNDVRGYLNRYFVLIKLDAESADEADYGGRTLTSRALAQQLRVSGYPTTVFLRTNGEHIASVPGYIPADRFKLMLQYIGEDHIGRGVSWQDFEKSAAAGQIHP